MLEIILLQVGGAVTNHTLWPSKANASDFVGQGEQVHISFPCSFHNVCVGFI